MPGADAHRRVSVERRKPCTNPHDRSDMRKYLPDGLTQCVLNNFTKKIPPYHVTQDAVSAPLQQLEVERITGHQSVRGRGGVIAVMYRTHRTGPSRPSWQREMDLQPLTPADLALLGWHSESTPSNQPPVSSDAIGAAQRELSRANGERFLAPGYGCVPRVDWLRHCSTTALQHQGAPQRGPFWVQSR